MPVTPTYPGVYIEEVPSGVRTIIGVATSITAFIGRALRGPVDKATRIQSFAEFQRRFGGLSLDSTMSYAVQQYFLHGGTDAIIIRVVKDADTAAIVLDPETGSDELTLQASSPGSWGNALRASVNYEATKDPATLFTLTVQELEAPGLEIAVTSETIVNLSTDPTNARFVATVLQEDSNLVETSGTIPTARPKETIKNKDDPNDPQFYVVADGNGSDGSDISDSEIATGPNLQADRGGIFALDEADLFNLLCIPPLTRVKDVGVGAAATLAIAAKYCKDRRAILIVDPKSGWSDPGKAEDGVNALRDDIGTDLSEYAAAYFPRIKMADPLRENRTEEFVPCGAVAGIISRTDAQAGVWQAPAGLEASFSGVRELSYLLNDPQNGRLNPLGLNCLRTFPVFGHVVWGARTLAGADRLASEWKYLPIRRLALFIEESLYRGTQWVVFEPNDEPLWAEIRLNVGAFMQNLFRQGAFQGSTPRDAYFVKCDKETTTPNDQDRGIVNILVGFAPLKPAEFVFVRIEQIAGPLLT